MTMTFTDMISNADQIYPFGSRVYGTHSESSDFDYVVVMRPGTLRAEPTYTKDEHHYQVYSCEEFLAKVNSHDIQALECICLPKSMWGKKNGYNWIKEFKLDKSKLRESISTTANHSWVKGKKKLIISADYDKHAGLKSIFHSIRILGLGIQLGTQGVIYQYSEFNWLWTELKKLGEEYDGDVLWNKINDRYKTLFNKTSTEFKLCAPKDLVVRDKNRILKELLEKYNCYDSDLMREITEIFEK